MRTVWRWLATTVWWLAVAAALLMATGALLANLFADRDTVVVRQALDAAAFVAGPFHGLFAFHTGGTATAPGGHDVPREDLVNWGVAAMVYLAVGRLLDALVRPANPPGPVDAPPAGPDGPGAAAGRSAASPQSP